MPGVAQPAIQEGQYVARLIRRRLAGKPDPAPFWYWDKGDLAIVGRTYALADLRFLRFAGFLGVDCLGRGAYLFSDRVRQPVLRRAGMGRGIFDEAPPGPCISGARESGEGTLAGSTSQDCSAFSLYGNGACDGKGKAAAAATAFPIPPALPPSKREKRCQLHMRGRR